MATLGNPYAAPSAHVAEAEEPVDDLWIASRTQRFFTFLIDLFCFVIFSFVVGIFIGLLGAGQAIAHLNPVTRQLFGITLMTAFYMLFEASTGRTPGKWICGTRVIDVEGEKPSFMRFLGRTLARFIPFEPFSFFGSKGMGWHDTVSGTRVVRTRGEGSVGLSETV